MLYMNRLLFKEAKQHFEDTANIFDFVLHSNLTNKKQ